MGCGPTCPPAASTATGAATATASAAPALCRTGRCRPSSNAFPAHADSHTSSEGEGGRRSRTPSAEAEGFPKDGPTGTDFVPTDTAVNSGGGACVLAAAPAPATAAAAPTTAPAIIAAAFAKGLTEAARSTCCCSSQLWDASWTLPRAEGFLYQRPHRKPRGWGISASAATFHNALRTHTTAT